MYRYNAPPEPQSFWSDEDGTTAVEYAVMLALIVAVCVGSIATLTSETKKSFDRSGEAISNAYGKLIRRTIRLFTQRHDGPTTLGTRSSGGLRF